MTQEAEQVIITTGVTDASPRPNPVDNTQLPSSSANGDHNSSNSVSGSGIPVGSSQSLNPHAAPVVQEQVIGILTHHNSSSAIKTAVNSQQVQDLPSRLVETDPNPTPSAAHLMQHEQALFGADQTSTIAPPMSIGHTEVVVLDTPNMSLMPPDGHSLTHEGTPYFLAPTAGLTMSSAVAGGGGKSAGGSGSSLLATGSPKDWLVGSEKEKQTENNAGHPTNHRAKMEGLSVPHKSQSVRGATTSGFPTSAMSPLMGPTSQGEEEERKARSSPQRRSPEKSRRDDYPDEADGSRRRRHHRHHRGRSRSYSPSRGSKEHRHRRTAGGGRSRRSRSPRSARSRSASYSSRGSSARSPRHRQRHSREYGDDASRQSSLRHRYNDDDRGRHRHRGGGGGGRQSERYDDGPAHARGSRRYDDRGDDKDDDWSHSRRHSGRARRSGHDNRRDDDDLYDDRRGTGRRSHRHHGGDDAGNRKDRSPPRRYDHEDSRRSKRARFEDSTVDRPHTSHRHSQGGGSRRSQGGGGGDRSGRNTSSRKDDLDAELAAYKR